MATIISLAPESKSVPSSPHVFFFFNHTYHIQFLVGVLVVLSLIEWTVHIGESGPVSSQVIGHGVNGIQRSAINQREYKFLDRYGDFDKLTLVW